MYDDLETIAGWASVKHPDYQTDNACRPDSNNGQISALVVTRIRKVEGGFGIVVAIRHSRFCP